MWKLLSPPAYKAEQTGPEADARYKKLRWQVFLGIFIGYAGFYIVRKNFSMAIPMLANFGFEKGTFYECHRLWFFKVYYGEHLRS